MNSVAIELADEGRFFKPGQKLKGSATWTADPAPHRVEVRLFWFTSGAAPTQVGIVNRSVIRNVKDRLSGTFEFTMPPGPWSFAGRLVTLHWAVEAVLFPCRANAITRITLSPNGYRINPFRQEEPEAEWREM